MEQPTHQSDQALEDVAVCGAARVQDGWGQLVSDVNRSQDVPVTEWSTQRYGRVLAAQGRAYGQAAGGFQVVSGSSGGQHAGDGVSRTSTGCQVLPPDVEDFSKTSMRCQVLPPDVKGFHRTSMACHPSDVEGFHRTSMACYPSDVEGFHRTSTGCRVLHQMARASAGLSQGVECFHQMARASAGFPQGVECFHQMERASAGVPCRVLARHLHTRTGN